MIMIMILEMIKSPEYNRFSAFTKNGKVGTVRVKAFNTVVYNNEE